MNEIMQGECIKKAEWNYPSWLVTSIKNELYPSICITNDEWISVGELVSQ